MTMTVNGVEVKQDNSHLRKPKMRMSQNDRTNPVKTRMKGGRIVEEPFGEIPNFAPTSKVKPRRGGRGRDEVEEALEGMMAKSIQHGRVVRRYIEKIEVGCGLREHPEGLPLVELDADGRKARHQIPDDKGLENAFKYLAACDNEAVLVVREYLDQLLIYAGIMQPE